MEEQEKIQAEEINTPEDGENFSAENTTEGNSAWSSVMLLFPLILSIYLFLGFTNIDSKKKDTRLHVTEASYDKDDEGDDSPKINFSALLAPEEFSKNLKDTVYTDKDLWLELRIDEQKLYVHYRNGTTKTLQVSTGNKFLSKGIESRPGLFAIFLKEEIHKSSQFNNAQMNYYMPYNMGIGFHGLPGTGYYGFLGKQPSSHGCIRMRNEDVRALFKECSIGVLVLAHRGSGNRTIAFAPEGFKNDAEYTKDDYINMMAYNLSNLMEGKYFTNPPKRFILDGTILPKSGINIISDHNPPKQMLPFAIIRSRLQPDKLVYNSNKDNVSEISGSEYADIFQFSETGNVPSGGSNVSVDAETIKKYVYNPVGILPYFAPNR